MEERRGESSDAWMEKAGQPETFSDIYKGTSDSLTNFFTQQEAKEEGRKYFLSLGINPDLSDSAKIVRQAELKAGSVLTPEEYQVALVYHKGKHSDVFHTLLKLRLGQL